MEEETPMAEPRPSWPPRRSAPAAPRSRRRSRQLRRHGHRAGRHRRQRQPAAVDAGHRRHRGRPGRHAQQREDITVFAPSNDAFAKVPAADLQALLADKEMLTQVLTYHVVGTPVSPTDLGTAGPFTSLQGAPVEVAGSGEDFTVNGASKVVCGGVQTANATVYIVDSVLMPPAA
jgi:hypothetical protein